MAVVVSVIVFSPSSLSHLLLPHVCPWAGLLQWRDAPACHHLIGCCYISRSVHCSCARLFHPVCWLHPSSTLKFYANVFLVSLLLQCFSQMDFFVSCFSSLVCSTLCISLMMALKFEFFNQLQFTTSSSESSVSLVYKMFEHMGQSWCSSTFLPSSSFLMDHGFYLGSGVCLSQASFFGHNTYEYVLGDLQKQIIIWKTPWAMGNYKSRTETEGSLVQKIPSRIILLNSLSRGWKLKCILDTPWTFLSHHLHDKMSNLHIS